MRATGIVRRIDELGRIVLPAEVRRSLDIGEREQMEIFVDGSSLVLRKYRPGCVFCGGSRAQCAFRGKSLCARCLAELRRTGDGE